MKNFLENIKFRNLSEISVSSNLNSAYFTNLYPSRDFTFKEWFYLFSVVNIVISFFAIIILAKIKLLKPVKRLLKKIFVYWMINSFFVSIYTLFRTQGVKVLSSRMVLLIILLCYVFIVIYGIIYKFTKLKKDVERYNEAVLRNKYLKKHR